MNSTYLHLENDEEFRTRLLTKDGAPGHVHSFNLNSLTGASLDEYVWNKLKMQRKLIWTTP